MLKYAKILVAIDFSAASEQVMERAMAVAEAGQGRLHLLHVVEYLPPIDFAYEPIASPGWNIDSDELTAQAEESMQKFIQRFQPERVSKAVLLGVPKHEIIRAARDQQADLIVLGSHGRHGLARLLGSTADPVLHNAPCDVLAVRIAE